MRKYFSALFVGFFLCFPVLTMAMLSMELTRGISGAVPITIKPFAVQGQTPPQDIAAIVSNDLQNSGRFKTASGNADNVVVGAVQGMGGDRYRVNFQLLEAYKGKTSATPSVLLERKYDSVSGRELRALAHHISDAVYQQITGVRGVFSTKLAYIVVQRSEAGPTRYTLEVSDQDGYNPRPLLTSTDPIMSPAWSPNGRQIAYVSFENHHASIYIEDVATGSRQRVSEFKGINGAPAWSPDGRKLALVLSKSGSPNIYIMDLGSHQLTQLTNDRYINTEPSWAPNGRSLIYTSDRGGSPQIYQLDINSRTATRLTYDGKYNARASFTSDGNHIVVLNRDSGLYNIGVLDLDGGVFRVLTNSGSDNESPSIAPNGSMVLFGTLYGGRSVLGMVATDKSVEIRLPARDGEVQDPAWSPFLS
jgi:TolB protein